MSTHLAFDHGKKKIGVAIGDSLTGSARGLATLPPDWAALEKLIQEWQPSDFVVGLPLDKDGGEQAATAAARNFARTLTERYKKPVHLCDERYSSIAAQSSLRARGQNTERDDAEAARLILEQYFHEQRP